MYIYIPNCFFQAIGVYFITDNGMRRGEPNVDTYCVKNVRNKIVEISTFSRYMKESQYSVDRKQKATMGKHVKKYTPTP